MPRLVHRSINSGAGAGGGGAAAASSSSRVIQSASLGLRLVRWLVWLCGQLLGFLLFLASIVWWAGCYLLFCTVNWALQRCRNVRLGRIADRMRATGQMLRERIQRADRSKGVCLTDTMRHPRSIEHEGTFLVHIRCHERFGHLPLEMRPAVLAVSITSEAELSYLRALVRGEEESTNLQLLSPLFRLYSPRALSLYRAAQRHRGQPWMLEHGRGKTAMAAVLGDKELEYFDPFGSPTGAQHLQQRRGASRLIDACIATLFAILRFCVPADSFLPYPRSSELDSLTELGAPTSLTIVVDTCCGCCEAVGRAVSQARPLASSVEMRVEGALVEAHYFWPLDSPSKTVQSVCLTGRVLHSTTQMALDSSAQSDEGPRTLLACRVTLAAGKTIVLWPISSIVPKSGAGLSLRTPHQLLVMDPALILPLWILTVDEESGPAEMIEARDDAASSADADERFARVHQIDVRPLDPIASSKS